MDPLLVFPAADLDTAGIPVDRELPVDWLVRELAEVEASAASPGRVVGRLSRSGTDHVVVRGEARATITVPCARCLAPAPVELVGDLSLLLRPGSVLPEPARAVREGDPAPKGPGRGPNGTRTPAKAAAEKTGGKVGTRGARGPAAKGGPGTEAVKALRGGAAARGPGAARGASGRGAAQKLPEFEFSADEADHDLYDGEEVVLDAFVREALLLEMPNFPLCSEDCPGIAPVPAEPAGPAEGEPAPAAGSSKLGEALRAALARKR